MFRRSLLGLVEGLLVGLGLAFACARGLGAAAPGALLLVLLGALAGFLVGLVAGRPVWARDAKTEAILKASAGALFGAGLSFAMQRWLSLPLNLSALSFGSGPAGRLAVVTVPAVACALALFFELDNTGSGAEPRRVGGAGPKQRLAKAAEAELGAEAESESLDDDRERRHEQR